MLEPVIAISIIEWILSKIIKVAYAKVRASYQNYFSSVKVTRMSFNYTFVRSLRAWNYAACLEIRRIQMYLQGKFI